MSEESSNKLNFNTILQEVGKFTRKVNSLSKILDFTIEEVIPKIFKEKTDDVLKITKGQLDYFLAHFI
jgi:hypothetical protein